MSSITVSTPVSTCLITGQPVQRILDFGQHPYADTFIGQDQLNLSEPVFPLQVCMNQQSGSIQLGYVSNAQERYNLYSYSYTSSNSKTSRDHWDEYAATVKKLVPEPGLVLEIGSNDGYLIQHFVNNSRRAIGIDPSAEMCELARKRGVEVMPALFCEPVAKDIANRLGPADIVMSNNVFNHANDPVDFARSVALTLSDRGRWIFEVPYWAEMIQSGRFTDMVYHEHPTYFTIKMVRSIFELVGLVIVDFDVVNYHGGSLRVIAGLSKTSAESPKVKSAIDHETQIGLFDVNMYQDLQRRFEQQRNTWLANFYQLKQNNPDAVIIGVGAAAKANTWLCWHGLDANDIHCITDASEFKQGKYTPLTRIPIKSDEEFAKHANPHALVLSWNIGESLKTALLNINPNTRFLSQ